MTRQETFDTVVRALVAQGAKSHVANQCSYRDEKGRKCAAGWLIPDNLYDPKMEGALVSERPVILGILTSAGHDPQLVQQLQLAHDSPEGDEFRKNHRVLCGDASWLDEFRALARETAAAFGLDAAAVDVGVT